MASMMEMSLEDIIQKKKKKNLRPNSGAKPLKTNDKSFKKPQIADARQKIILKKRNQITDAREKLAQLAKRKDARLRLEEMRKQRVAAANHGRNTRMPIHTKFNNRSTVNKERVFLDPSRQVVSQPLSRSTYPRRQLNTKKVLSNRSFETRLVDRPMKLKPILRTVENYIEINDDPMGGDDVPMSSYSRKANLQLRIIAHNNEPRESRSSARRLTTPEKEKSPPRPQSILKKRPMAALRSEQKTEKSEKPSLEHRIIVSNLRSSVTGGDIQELFGDVGGMVESRLVRPGTAEVIYKTVEDAQKAVDLYHNRQLDGQPMNCLLVTPRFPSAPARNANIPALYSTNSNVEPDISTFHKVLFSNF